jgi:nucleotide-binding universal stress UspA family protein
MAEATEPLSRWPKSAAPVVQLEPRPPAAQPAAALVVGFDRSAASLAALRQAADLCVRLDAELHVVHAIDLADYPVDPDADDWEEQAAKNLEEERRQVSSALVAYPGGWSYLALRAEPAEALVRVANQVDALMIVVGVRPGGWRHLLERLAGPSVSHRLITHCHRPVLLVSTYKPG